MLRRIATLLSVVCTLLALGSGGSRADGIDTLAIGASSPAITDGHQFAAWTEQPGTLRVLNAGTGEQSDVDLASGCLMPPIGAIAVGGGQVLFSCMVPHDETYDSDQRPEPRLFDLATQAIEVPEGAAQVIDLYDSLPMGIVGFDGVGAYGLSYSGSGYHTEYSVGALNWHSGTDASAEGTATTVPDLDAPTLATPLCAPLRQRPWDKRGSNGPFGEPMFDPFTYEQPYAIVDGPYTSLTLERCGSTRSLVIEPWRRRVSRATGADLASSFVTWFVVDPLDVPWTNSALHAYLPQCGVRLAWTVDPRASVEHLAGAIVLSEPATDRTWTIRRIELGGICERTRAAWTLTAASGARSARTFAASATLQLPDRSRAVAQLWAPSPVGSAVLTVRAGTRIRLRPGTSAHAVRWRIGTGRWQTLRATRARWSVAPPPIHHASTLGVEVRYRQGGIARFVLRLRPLG